MDEKYTAVLEKKESKSYSFVSTKVGKEIMESLAKELYSHYVLKAKWIKSVKRIPKYDGFQHIIITYYNDFRTVYHFPY